jgi:hypothetical protein
MAFRENIPLFPPPHFRFLFFVFPFSFRCGPFSPADDPARPVGESLQAGHFEQLLEELK